LKPIIEVNNLSKKFIITHEGKEKYTALRDVIVQNAKKIFSFPSSLRPSQSITKEEFWALKDISFEVQQGDRIGIIGRNGAGKSTLLKILSRITEPTVGEIKIRGRVASLLEVGTGFHPELTGRENIFLNGAILGMSRKEIKSKFDEIVDFAEVERFLDTPVKRYSSGMYVRLAFAVAAHLEPEVLIVDEVLAVGDAQFQKKCLGKMEDVSKNEGRTVLFVSHNMGIINSLCNNAVLLNTGRVSFIGSTNETIHQYMKATSNTTSGNNKYKDILEIKHIKIFQNNYETLNLVNGIKFSVLIFFEVFIQNVERVTFELSIKNDIGNKIIFIPLGLASNFNFKPTPGLHELAFDINLPFMAESTYHIDLIIAESGIGRLFTFSDIVSFDIIEAYLTNSAWTFKNNEENILIKPENIKYKNFS
jgi:lipopolysaccharide transport system ATP-binding protein